MTLSVSVDGVPLEGRFSAPFFAIRIGTDAQNTIVVAANTPGVHQHHCTIVHTGSTYRLEMLPTHLVFVDGERGECGQQLFLHNTRKCVLSIGGAPPPARKSAGPGFAPPPQITLERLGPDLKPGMRPDHRGPATNRDIGKFLRVSVRNLIAGLGLVAFLLAAWIGVSIASAAALSERLDQTAKLAELPPGPDIAERARESVFQIGLMDCGGLGTPSAEPCDFYPAGTVWVWNDGNERRLVTNVHVIKAINDCSLSTSAESRDKCIAPAGSCPAVRYFAGAPESRHQKIEALADCSQDAFVHARIHGDYEAFERWTRQSASAGALPNVYDIAIIDWPPTLTWNGAGLRLPAEMGTPNYRLRTGEGVGLFGYPSEGGIRTDWNAGNAQFRPGSVGRTQDAFGLPSQEEFLLTISGPEVIGGESGGPVIDARGEVVAMTFANFSQQGDAQLGRISYGARMKALSLKLLTERDRFAPLEASGSKPSETRLGLWREGLQAMSRGRRTAVVERFRQETCPDGTVRHDRPAIRRQVTASVPTDFRTSVDGATSGWSYSEDLELSSQPESTSHVIVMASSAGASPHQVLLSYRRGQYSRLESSDPTLTFASVPDTLAFPAQSPVRTVTFTLFSPDAAGRDALFDIEIHQADCLPEPTQ